jgi:hypothetical protein
MMVFIFFLFGLPFCLSETITSHFTCHALAAFDAQYAVDREMSVFEKMLEMKCQFEFFRRYVLSLLNTTCFAPAPTQMLHGTCEFKFKELSAFDKHLETEIKQQE